MPQYAVSAFCRECGELHRLPIPVNLPDCFSVRTLRDAFVGKRLPDEVAEAKDQPFQCPKTGTMVIQPDESRIYLFPAA
jgi:hypothetical protein